MKGAVNLVYWLRVLHIFGSLYKSQLILGFVAVQSFSTEMLYPGTAVLAFIVKHLSAFRVSEEQGFYCAVVMQ